MLNKKMADYIRNFEGITVSQGTLNTIDLVCAFIDFINDYTENNDDIIKQAYRLLSVEYDEVDSLVNAQYYDEIDINYVNLDNLNDFLNNDLFEKMEELAPKGFYFSSQEGDGACFGYWMIRGEF